MERRLERRGFTLLEIIIAVAIVAIMAGSVAPLVFRQLSAARRDATLDELAGLQRGLLDFYEDVGRFPSESEGLAALVVDPGVANWQGPYVEGGSEHLVDAVATDAFGLAYIFDATPTVSPTGSVAVLVVSGGVNRTVDAGSLNHTWDLVNSGDDIYAAVSAGPVQRDKVASSQGELETLATACRNFFRDHAAFPATSAELAGDYLDAGYQNAALVDGWNSDYRLALLAGPAPILRVSSDGPDRTNNGGGGDDLQLTVSSVPPGREATTYELAIAQAALNAQPTLILAGAWAGGIRTQLGLADAFDLDGWARSYQVNVASRVIYSAGPDGNAATLLDNLPVGVGP
jgi:general secretion pathway protein G